jgi:hypothetical protein
LQLARDGTDFVCYLQRVSFAFNNAWTGDEEEPSAEIDTVNVEWDFGRHRFKLNW